MRVGWPAVGWEDRDWSWPGGLRPPRADRLFTRYRSAVPPRIADADAWLSGAVANRVAAAEAAIARLDAQRPADLTAFSGLLLRSESVASSKIEHLDVSHRDVSAAMVGARSSRSTAGRVAANLQAMQLAIGKAGLGDEFTLDDLLSIHHVLMRDDPYEGRCAGTVRQDQNWIGGSDHAPREALFVPPRPELVSTLLEDLVAFMNRADLPPIVQAAIAHAQFETIHPFGDGNGRTGRVLIHAVLRRRRAVQKVNVPVSTVLLADPEGYFDGLTAYRDGDLGLWLTRFADAAARAAEHGQAVADEFEQLRREWWDEVKPRTGSTVEALLHVASRQPVMTVEHLRDALPGASDPAIYRAIDRLCRAGVLVEVTGYGRNRVWAAQDVLDLLDEFERTVGRRRLPQAIDGG